ncbi:MAG: crotonase/enoyl-CoA hydratase family protein [Myxococcota bacterium]|nr:crotonase/enoyl-CoA hydratase family protein [Myxococcota bacterium]
MAEQPHLLVEKEGHVVTLTMNRPEAKNAWTLEMMARLWDAWQMIDGDDDVRVAILTGAGDAFCAGADLKMMHGDQSNNPWYAKFEEDPELHWKAMLRHYRLKKPLIAAVDGIALGGGTEIVLTTDIRVASESSMFGLTEPKWALFPLGGSTVRLPRQIPYTMAMEMLLTGRMMKAEEAKAMGLIGTVVKSGEVLTHARMLANKIANNGPLAVQAIKKSATEGLLKNELEALKDELSIGSKIIFDTEDAKEGPQAFAEKRKPEFKGR